MYEGWQWRELEIKVENTLINYFGLCFVHGGLVLKWTHQTSPRCCGSMFERNVNKMEGSPSTWQRGTRTAASRTLTFLSTLMSFLVLRGFDWENNPWHRNLFSFENIVSSETEFATYLLRILVMWPNDRNVLHIVRWNRYDMADQIFTANLCRLKPQVQNKIFKLYRY